jgi:hypothetical protein
LTTQTGDNMTKKPPPALILTFAEFYEGDYHGNLYIVWRGSQALYVGITRDHVWNRWFGNRGHISNIDGNWRADYCGSEIGKVIVKNRPESLGWKIELRNIPYPMDLESEERRLIHELRPLCNRTHVQQLTKEEMDLWKSLTRYDEEIDLKNAPCDNLGLTL